MLRQGTNVGANSIAAQRSTKKRGLRAHPEMQVQRGNQWHFGIKAHIGVDVDFRLVHTATTTAANAADVSQVEAPLDGKKFVHADADYLGAQQRVKPGKREWHVAAKRGAANAIKDAKLNRIIEERETLKARIRAHVKHPFRVIKRRVRIHEGALQRVGEEHRPGDHAACTVDSSDGAQAIVDSDRAIASAVRELKEKTACKSRNSRPLALLTTTASLSRRERPRWRACRDLFRPCLS